MKRASLLILAAATPLVVSAAAVATQSGTSQCPGGASGFISWNISAEPYQMDNRADKNGNGLVCAQPTKKTFIEDGVTYTIYNFIDDVLR